MTNSVCRCPWCGDDPLYRAYHDLEWGVPLHDDTRLFEMLTLEGAQAGLSWITVLRKREGYRRAFAGFDVREVAAFGDDDIVRLLADPGIIRNRLKVSSTITNARAVLEARERHGSLDACLWSFVDGAHYQMVENFTDYLPGHLQVHRKGFQLKKSLTLLTDETPVLEKIVAETHGVQTYSKRIETVGL